MSTGADEGTTERGFEEIVRRLLPRIRRRALQVTGCPHASDDAVQDVWLRLHRHRHRLVRHPEPDAYAHAALASVLRDGWRRQRRVVPVPVVPEPADAVPDCAQLVEPALEVDRLLATLSAPQAAVVRLVDVRGLTHDEAARTLGLHRGTVARTRRRALDRLRSRID